MPFFWISQSNHEIKQSHGVSSVIIIIIILFFTSNKLKQSYSYGFFTLPCYYLVIMGIIRKSIFFTCYQKHGVLKDRKQNPSSIDSTFISLSITSIIDTISMKTTILKKWIPNYSIVLIISILNGNDTIPSFWIKFNIERIYPIIKQMLYILLGQCSIGTLHVHSNLSQNTSQYEW